MQQTDICFAPVLTMSEAIEHEHNRQRGSFVDVDGVAQPGPAPKFLGTPTKVRSGPAYCGENTDEVLHDWGFSAAEIAALHASGAVKSAE
jgi:alpha-methylacyl-CoA racemase